MPFTPTRSCRRGRLAESILWRATDPNSCATSITRFARTAWITRSFRCKGSLLACRQIGSQAHHDGSGSRALASAESRRRANTIAQGAGQRRHDEICDGIHHHRHAAQNQELQEYLPVPPIHELRYERKKKE